MLKINLLSEIEAFLPRFLELGEVVLRQTYIQTSSIEIDGSSVISEFLAGA